MFTYRKREKSSSGNQNVLLSRFRCGKKRFPVIPSFHPAGDLFRRYYGPAAAAVSKFYSVYVPWPTSKGPIFFIQKSIQNLKPVSQGTAFSPLYDAHGYLGGHQTSVPRAVPRNISYRARTSFTSDFRRIVANISRCSAAEG